MNTGGTSLLEWSIVALLVGASALFALWRLLPSSWRVRLQIRLGWRVRNADCGCDACPTTRLRDSGSSEQ